MCDMVADFLVCNVSSFYVLGVKVNRGGDVVSVPFCLLGGSDEVCSVPEGALMLAVHFPPWDASLCGVFPNGSAEHGGVGVVYERSGLCFGSCVCEVL